MKLKGLIGATFAGLLVAMPLASLADDDGRRGSAKHGQGGWDDRWDDRWDRRDRRWDRDRRDRRRDGHHRGWRRHDGRLGYWYAPPRGWRGGWYYVPPRRHFGYRKDFRRGYRDSYWDRRGSAFISGAITGSLLTGSLLHDRGDHRHCDHGSYGDSRIGRCYRIERLPGGGERRVELPASACR